MSIVAKQSPISATTELLLYNRKINMTFEMVSATILDDNMWNRMKLSISDVGRPELEFLEQN